MSRKLRKSPSPVGGIAGGLVIIWLGVCFILAGQGLIPRNIWWVYFIAGMGVMFAAGAVVRLLIPRWRKGAWWVLGVGSALAVVGGLFGARIIPYAGTGFLPELDMAWAWVVIGLGVLLGIIAVIRYLLGKKK